MALEDARNDQDWLTWLMVEAVKLLAIMANLMTRLSRFSSFRAISFVVLVFRLSDKMQLGYTMKRQLEVGYQSFVYQCFNVFLSSR